MKQLLSLFLLLLPCLAWAQYPSNGNQKITLGEQTTADGLIYRGVLADTGIITPSSDTSAYIILDTVNHRFYNYNRATNVWSMAGVGSISSGLTGVLPVANGGTGKNTLTANKVLVGNGTSGILSPSNLTYSNEVLNLGISTDAELVLSQRGNAIKLENSSLSVTQGGAGLFISNNALASKSINNRLIKNYSDVSNFIGMRYDRGIHFSTNISGSTNTSFPDDTLNRMMITLNGNIGIGTTFAAQPTEKLHVVGNARITAMNGINDIGASATGVLQAATSDMNLKNTIENSPFGLNEILLLNPVTFLYNDTNRKIDSDVKEVGFIAQDVFDVIPNAVSSTGTGDLQLDYRAITATLVKAIQEQNAFIKALEQRIINLENK